ncbi:MAG TPA: shikimate dehydrogenase [Burkholderiales bacterium]|nr:shikimate dehydrogenase [Burkholderiales bacterium]
MTDRYAVIGNPVAHSKSPRIHAEFARQTGEDIAYEKLHAELAEFEAAVQRFGDEGGRGLNVTVPFKHRAHALASRSSVRAEQAGAVNTLAFGADGIAGDNTDGVGLVRDLTVNLGCEIAGRRVLLVGAGGASFGVCGPLLDRQPACLVIANRTVEKAVALAQRFAGYYPGADLIGIGYDALGGRAFDVVINATSAGLSGEMPALGKTVFARGALAYDMVYGRATPFLELAADAGARTADGLGMLVEQAAESFFVWRGVRPDTAPVIALLRSGG